MLLHGSDRYRRPGERLLGVLPAPEWAPREKKGTRVFCRSWRGEGCLKRNRRQAVEIPKFSQEIAFGFCSAGLGFPALWLGCPTAPFGIPAIWLGNASQRRRGSRARSDAGRGAKTRKFRRPSH